MASTTEKRDISFKHALDVHHTRTDKQWFEETYGTRHVVPGPEVWAEHVPYNDAASAVSAGLAVEEVSFVLTEDPFSDGRLWVSKSNAGVWPYNGPLTDYTQLDAERVRNWISPVRFGPSSVDGYTYVLSQNDGTPIPDGNWEFHFPEGLLHLDDGYTAVDEGWSTPLKLTAYRYTGGMGVGSTVKLRTTEAITMEVDPATGVSPPDGTLVTSQAEYDALGAPLEFIQDVFRILPSRGLDHPIKVVVASGTHLARPGTGGNISMFADIPSYSSTEQIGGWDFVFGLPYGPGILFEGQKSAIESGVAGTLATYSFTRSSGTWTPGALVGKQFDIVSGAGAGSSRLVVENDATTVYFSLAIFSTGAATINLWEPGTVFLSSEDGINPTFYGMLYRYGSYSSNSPIIFKNVQWGTGALHFGSIQMYGLYLVLNECRLIGSDVTITPYSEGRTAIEIGNSHITLDGYYGFWMRGPEIRGNMNGVLFTGSPTATILRLQERTSLYMTGARFIPDAGFAGACLRAEGESWMSLGDDVQIDGVATCTGLQLLGDGTQSSGIKGELRIKNCNLAVEASGVSINASFPLSGSSGNTTGWQVRYGSRVVMANPSNIGAATELLLDSDSFSYADVLGSVGDEVVGVYGSSFLRR